MPMETAEIDQMKKLIDVSRKQALNFGLCLASKAPDCALYIDKLKSPDILAKRAKKTAKGSKVAYGTLETSGKEITFTLRDKAPAGMKLTTKDFLKAHDLAMQINIVEGSDTEAALPEKDSEAEGRWLTANDKIAQLMAEVLPHLTDAGKIRAAHGFAQQKAEDEDYAAAIKTLAQVNKLITDGLANYAAPEVAIFEKAKSQFSVSQRDELRVLIAEINDKAGKKDFSGADGLRKTLKAKVVEYVRSAKEGVQETLDTRSEERKAATTPTELVKELKTLQEEVETLKTARTKMSDDIKDLRARMKGAKGTKGQKIREELSSVNQQLKEANQTLSSAKKRIRALPDEIARQRRENEGSYDEKHRSLMATIEQRAKALDVELGEVTFEEARAALKDTAEKMAEASEWREDEFKRANADHSHGSGRHGAQTGVDRQSRRAATGNVTPDSPSNPSGTARQSVTWDKVKIEWEEDDNGKRKVITREEVNKAVIDNTTHFTTTKASSFHSPVLEKEAVDMAIKKLDDAGWTHINDNGWQELTYVELVVGPPSGQMNSWGYQVQRNGAQLTANAANGWLDKFEKGEIDINKLMDELHVEYLMQNAKALMPIPYAVVRLQRAKSDEQWKSKTHFPNADKSAQSWSIEGKQVRKDGGAVATARF